MANYHYFVEGEMDKKMINVLKTHFRYIYPGKVEVINVVLHKISKSRLMKLRSGTKVILVFDTDRSETEILKKNLEILDSYEKISNVICIPQNKNFEDELVRSCNIRKVKDFNDSSSIDEFKRKFLHVSDENLKSKLKEKDFDIKKMWSLNSPYPYDDIDNGADKIKIQKNIL